MEHYDWNEGWLFAPTFDPALVRPECQLELTPVRLPHTVKVLPYNYCNENEYQRLCGYRREFFAPKEWEGRTVLLTFGAIAHDATVFCNGRRLFHHGCGYTSFTVDLTCALRLGQKNVVAVRCDCREDLNIPPFGGQMDQLTYGGIYRAVCLDIKEPAYLRDVFIEAKAAGDFHIYSSTVGETVGCTLQAEIRSPAGSRALYNGVLSLPITGTLNGVHPWSVEHPTLYTLTVRLIRPGTGGLPDRVLDEKTLRFGFRTLQFVAGGLYLNGQRVELRGLNRHQSYAYQGYAMPDSIQRLDAQILKKQLGCNAVRTSCYDPAFLDACDELGLLVFAEMPGWQHVGDDGWKAQALQNCREMVCQCRNHPSIFLWGARVSGSADDEAFCKRTNEAIHRLDPTRPTGGTHQRRKGLLLEDVYAYNDYSYRGRGTGCEPRAAVTPDTRKGYLISEFGGQQFPTKAFDDESHRLMHALRIAAVLNDTIAQQGVAGSFGWCMADYNTHREFGSGDRICYHGVLDLFRNPKLAAAVYASQKIPRAPSDIVLEVSSGMVLGDLPEGMAGACWVFTNAESLRLYRDNDFVAEFAPDRRGRFAALPHPPIEVNDFVGSLLEKYEGLDHAVAPQVAAILNEMRRDAMELSPLSRARMLSLRLSWNDLVQMYYKYIGVLGSPSAVYRFEAVWHGRAVRTVVREPVQSVRLECTVHNPLLTDGPTWDCAAVSLRAIDQNGNLLPYCSEAVQLWVEGPLQILGPSVVPLRGGMAGTYLATTGEAGPAVLHCRMEGALDTHAALVVRRREG
ncbi:MAG: glycoside hydrolase family 2 TIM barrel-domain containing protein [Faecalibacterium prausnitzii]|nr:glycoside hydrolase family 2 TIM barrel-domain containing protein [Faecalibacterium prausnitzii]